MPTLKETRIGFITTILMPYIEGTWPYSIDAGLTCRYNGPNGEHCAFARCVTNPTDLADYEGRSASFLVRERIGTLTPAALACKFQSETFSRLQQVHDQLARGDYETAINRLNQLEISAEVLLPTVREAIERISK